MKKLHSFIFTAMLCALVLLSATACMQAPPSAPSDPNSEAAEELPALSAEEQEEMFVCGTQEERAKLLNVPVQELDQYEKALWELCNDGSLRSSWQGTPVPTSRAVPEFYIDKIEHDGSKAVLSVTLRDEVYFDFDTMKESWDNGYLIQIPRKDFLDSYIPVGHSVVVVQNETPGPVFLSCEYTPIESPGMTQLKKRTEQLSEELAASPKVKEKFPEIDRYLLNALWLHTACVRSIESPEDVTMYDLEHIENFTLNYSTATMWDKGNSMPNEGYVMDGEPIRFMKQLKYAEISCLLKDYSVFENQELEDLILYSNTSQILPSNLDTLKLKKVNRLDIDFDRDFTLDLEGASVKSLRLTSWSAGIRAFKGCEKVEYLTICSTTTDTTLINRDAFPNAESINLEFYSDFPRFRNLSALSTFEDSVYISIALNYHAANRKTIDSLAGVRITLLTLQPKDGPYPPPDPDPEALSKIDVDPDFISVIG